MSKYSDLKGDFEAAVAQMEDITTTAETEARAVTKEEQETFDKLDAKCDLLAQQIKQEEALLKRKAQVEAGRVPVSAGRVVPPVQPGAPIISPSGVQQITIPATVKRWGNLKSFPGPAGDVKAYRAGMFFYACCGNEGARKWLDEHGISFSSAAQKEGINTSGGYLVYDELDSAIIDLREKYGVFSRNARRVAMTKDVMIRPRRSGGLTAYFVGEDEAVKESNKSWDKVQLITKKLGVIARISNELSEDAIISIGDDLTNEISWAFAQKLDKCGFIGDGTSDYGGIVGVCQRLADVNYATPGTADDGGGIVWTSGTNLFSEIAITDLVKVISILPSYAQPRAKWYCSNAVYGQVLLRLLASGQGNTIVTLEQGQNVPKCMGYPVEITQTLPSTNANNQIALLFGDLALAADFGDRRQTTIKFSDSAVVGGNSVFERDETAIIGTMRFDINVHDVGTATEAGPIVGFAMAT